MIGSNAAATRVRKPATSREFVERIVAELGTAWLPAIYRDRVRRMRTRAFQLPPTSRSTSVTIQHTLLGVELKIGRRRILCPDLATARYLSVFARAGCTDVAIPYDISRVSVIADDLESAWQQMLLRADHALGREPESVRARLRGKLAAMVRAEIAVAGAGPAMPEFNQNTKQRRS